jgi:hypothetical protein
MIQSLRHNFHTQCFSPNIPNNIMPQALKTSTPISFYKDKVKYVSKQPPPPLSSISPLLSPQPPLPPPVSKSSHVVKIVHIGKNKKRPPPPPPHPASGSFSSSSSPSANTTIYDQLKLIKQLQSQIRAIQRNNACLKRDLQFLLSNMSIYGDGGLNWKINKFTSSSPMKSSQISKNNCNDGIGKSLNKRV